MLLLVLRRFGGSDLAIVLLFADPSWETLMSRKPFCPALLPRLCDPRPSRLLLRLVLVSRAPAACADRSDFAGVVFRYADCMHTQSVSIAVSFRQAICSRPSHLRLCSLCWQRMTRTRRHPATSGWLSQRRCRSISCFASVASLLSCF